MKKSLMVWGAVGAVVVATAMKLGFQQAPTSLPPGCVTFVYPQNATNYVWWLDASSNMHDWFIYAGPFGPPDISTNYYLDVTNGGEPSLFFRMRGVEIYHSNPSVKPPIVITVKTNI